MTSGQQNSNVVIAAGGLLLLAGFAFFAVTQTLFGIDWSNIWPVLPALVGVSALAGACITEDHKLRTALTVWGTLLLLLGLFFFGIALDVWRGGQAAIWPVYLLMGAMAMLAGHAASGFESQRHLPVGVALAMVGAGLLALVRFSFR